jgi:hypothetical protein
MVDDGCGGQTLVEGMGRAELLENNHTRAGMNRRAGTNFSIPVYTIQVRVSHSCGLIQRHTDYLKKRKAQVGNALCSPSPRQCDFCPNVLRITLQQTKSTLLFLMESSTDKVGFTFQLFGPTLCHAPNHSPSHRLERSWYIRVFYSCRQRTKSQKACYICPENTIANVQQRPSTPFLHPRYLSQDKRHR